MPFYPDSWGSSDLHEFNKCHLPGGIPAGGQFCSDPEVTRVGITSARKPEDVEHHRSNRVVAREMRTLERALKGLPGVRNVEVKPALGQWGDGSEFSWAVSYTGNGEARKALARVGKRWNQDGILIMREPRRGETPDAATELSFDTGIGRTAREGLAPYMAGLGLQGWTWFKENGRTTLRIVSVPQWGGSRGVHRKAIKQLSAKLRSEGRAFRSRDLAIKAEVYERDRREGVPSFEDVLKGR